MAIQTNPFGVLGSDIVSVDERCWVLRAPLTGGPWAGCIGGEKVVSDGRIRLTGCA